MSNLLTYLRRVYAPNDFKMSENYCAGGRILLLTKPQLLFSFFLGRTLLARTSMRPRGSPTGVECLEVGIHHRALMEGPAPIPCLLSTSLKYKIIRDYGTEYRIPYIPTLQTASSERAGRKADSYRARYTFNEGITRRCLCFFTTYAKEFSLVTTISLL